MKTILFHTHTVLTLDRSPFIVRTLMSLSFLVLLSVLFSFFVHRAAGFIFLSVLFFVLISVFVVYVVINHTHAIIDKENKKIQLWSTLFGVTIGSEKIVEFEQLVLDYDQTDGTRLYAICIDTADGKCVWTELSLEQKTEICTWLIS